MLLLARITAIIPIAKSKGVPIGLSFLAGFGQDMMLINFCNEFQKKLAGNDIMF